MASQRPSDCLTVLLILSFDGSYSQPRLTRLSVVKSKQDKLVRMPDSAFELAKEAFIVLAVN
jgi:hypothetical protein